VKRESKLQGGVAILVFPLRNPDQECGQLYLGMFSRILAGGSGDVVVVTGNYYPEEKPAGVRVINVASPVVKSVSESVLSKVCRLLLAQFTLSMSLLRVRGRIGTVVVLFGRGSVILPTLVAKILRKRIIIVATGSESQSLGEMYGGLPGRAFSWLTLMLENINCRLADVITVGSPGMVEAMSLQKCRGKVVTGVQLHYLDVERFRIQRGIEERDCIIGYIGRLSAEKGVLELAEAIPLISAKVPDARFLIVGDGPLRGEMMGRLEQASCSDLVDFTGWVPYERIPELLNTMKIHILPSHTEALGGTNLEAMACGTISVVNSVGGLPDVVTDGLTGFLLMDNSPRTIADTTTEMLRRADLEGIQRNARLFVEENFGYERVVGQWRQVLRNLGTESN
jgi:glycosyltransferase involved in cell wall biosynthesis